MKPSSLRQRISLALAGLVTMGGATGVATVAFQSVAWAACEGTAIDAKTVTLPVAAAQVNAPAAWAAGFDGGGVDVAVIDTGVVAVPGLSSTGKIIDAADLSTDSGNEALRFRDGEGHGTSMAGIIAGDASGGPMSKGVAPGARIINVKVAASDGSVDVSQVVAAIDWVVQNKTSFGRNIRVLNLSYTTDAATDYKFDPLTHAVETAWKAGIVVVASAGNDGKALQRLGNPAADPFVLAVGAASFDAATGKFTVPDWSSHGNGARNPDVVAPGTDIASLRVPGSLLDATYPAARFYDPATCTSFFRGSGTSQSAAVASGAVALLLQQRPSLTPDQVKALLRSSARSASASAQVQGSGVIDVAALLAAPTPAAAQSFAPSTGKGSLEAARGSNHLKKESKDKQLKQLDGEKTAQDTSFNSDEWSRAATNRSAWTNQIFDSKGRFVSGTWSGSSWSGSSWSGSSWSGSSWSGSSWSGSSWR
jgi:serine protease AprX